MVSMEVVVNFYGGNLVSLVYGLELIVIVIILLFDQAR